MTTTLTPEAQGIADGFSTFLRKSIEAKAKNKRRKVAAAVPPSTPDNDTTLPPPRESWKYCRTAALVGVSLNQIYIADLLCHSWNCPECALDNGWKWRRTLYYHYEQGTWTPCILLTLTLDPAKLVEAGISLTDYEAQRDWFVRKFARFIARLRRATGDDESGCTVPHFRVFEFHKGAWSFKWKVHNHRLHIHAILDCPLPAAGPLCVSNCRKGKCSCTYDPYRDVYSQFAHELGLGRTEAVEITISDALHYVTKYTTKAKSDVHRFRMRVTGASQELKHPPREKGDSDTVWSLVSKSGERLDELQASLAAVSPEKTEHKNGKVDYTGDNIGQLAVRALCLFPKFDSDERELWRPYVFKDTGLGFPEAPTDRQTCPTESSTQSSVGTAEFPQTEF